jgi:hypothetical protein
MTVIVDVHAIGRPADINEKIPSNGNVHTPSVPAVLNDPMRNRGVAYTDAGARGSRPGRPTAGGELFDRIVNPFALTRGGTADLPSASAWARCPWSSGRRSTAKTCATTVVVWLRRFRLGLSRVRAAAGRSSSSRRASPASAACCGPGGSWPSSTRTSSRALAELTRWTICAAAIPNRRPCHDR